MCMVVPDEMVADFGASAVFSVLDGSTSVTLSIVGRMETITPIPEKYLPKNAILYVGSQDKLYKTKDTSSDDNLLTVSEIQNMLERGVSLYICKVNENGAEIYRPVNIVQISKVPRAAQLILSISPSGAVTYESYVVIG